MTTSPQTEKERALLKKYLAGQCTAEEEALVENWYQSFNNSPYPDVSEEKRALGRVGKSLLNEIRTHQKKTFRLPKYLRIAATLFLLSAVSLIIYMASNTRSKDLLVYSAATGEHKRIVLDDGSIVSLNAMSSLRIDPDFNKEVRAITLSGEAYFEVAKNPDRPFIVHTGSVSTRVLGTAFNVQAYNNESDLTITVAEGKVRVDHDQTDHHKGNINPGILPGYQLVYHKSTQKSSLTTADAEHVAAWRKGVLYFDNESIPDIARKLERKFNIKIDVTGAARSDCRYTLRISDETLSKTLQVLSTVSGITCKFNQQNHLIINTTECK